MIEVAAEHKSLGKRCWHAGLRCAYLGLLVYWFVRRPKSDGAYIAVWYDDEILLIKNSYKTVFTLPCGGRHRHESLVEAAIRELWEEVGIQADESHMLEVGVFYSDLEHKHDYSTVFELILTKKPSITLDGREVIWSRFLPAQEALRYAMADIPRQYLLTKAIAAPG